MKTIKKYFAIIVSLLLVTTAFCQVRLPKLVSNGTLYVNSGSVAINNIKVFDIQGRLIAEQKNVKATTASIKDLKATHQVLIVEVFDVDKNVVVKKIVN